MIKSRRSFIIGIKGIKINRKEISFIKKYKPWGVILFTRNIKTIEQTKRLTNSIRKIYKDKNFPILVDQEGGRVARLNNIILSTAFPGNFFGNMYKKDPKNLNYYLDIYINQISYLLREIGINLNTSPVLDLKVKNTTKIIGDRAFSSNIKNVNKIGDFVIEKFHYIRTPYIYKNLNYLKRNDFKVFKNKKSIFAMTAHIIFSKIDPTYTVTHSKKLINIIRNEINFKNLIISDDISMKSLKFSTLNNTQKAFQAGCNLVLHCNARMSEMKVVAENSPKLDNFLLKKTLEFYKLVNIK